VSIVGINNYLLTIYFVEGKSMENGYHTGDRMLVNKIPILSAQLNGREYVPKRGDIVIVRAIFGKVAAYDAKNSDTNLVKRVIGLPNDRVVVRNGVVTIYNQEQPNGFLPDKGSSWESTMVPNLKAEELDIKLGASELFVAGDNRPESIDSRFNGALETKEVVGTVIAKF
jgi:signal peptidase I